MHWEGYGPDEDMWKLATDLDRRGPVQEFEKEQLAQRADDDYEAGKPKKAAPKAPPVVKAGPTTDGPVGSLGETAADASAATQAAASPSPATAKGARKAADKTQKKSAPNRAAPSPSSAKKNKVQEPACKTKTMGFFFTAKAGGGASQEAPAAVDTSNPPAEVQEAEFQSPTASGDEDASSQREQRVRKAMSTPMSSVCKAIADREPIKEEGTQGGAGRRRPWQSGEARGCR